jgi:hypothetical protein
MLFEADEEGLTRHWPGSWRGEEKKSVRFRAVDVLLKRWEKGHPGQLLGFWLS